MPTVKRCATCGYKGEDGHWVRDCPQNPAKKLKDALTARIERGELTRTCRVEGGAELELVTDGSLSIASDSELRTLLKQGDFQWSSKEQVWLRVKHSPEATALNLVRLGAVTASTFEDEICIVESGLYHTSQLASFLRAKGFNFVEEDAFWTGPIGASPTEINEANAMGASVRMELIQPIVEAAERRKQVEMVKQSAFILKAAWHAVDRHISYQRCYMAIADQTLEYKHASRAYGQKILEMQACNSFPLGSDGVPNIPSPPLPPCV